MAEIKSTLDLVMQKTKHLHLSEEEREEQKTIEIEKKIKGLLQKFQDRALLLDQLETEYEHLRREYNLTDHNMLISEIFNRLDVDTDDQGLLAIMRDVCHLHTREIESIWDAYRDAVHAVVSQRLVALKKQLARTHKISGSAVVPNLEIDRRWRAEAGTLRATLKKQLDCQKDELLGKQ